MEKVTSKTDNRSSSESFMNVRWIHHTYFRMMGEAQAELLSNVARGLPVPCETLWVSAPFYLRTLRFFL